MSNAVTQSLRRVAPRHSAPSGLPRGWTGLPGPHNPRTMVGKGVFHSVQALRAVAAAVVALYHSQITFQRASEVAPGFDTYLFRFGAVGVHIFFVISGFVMVATTAGKQFRPAAFLRRRLVRIYPIYWVCAAIYVAIYLAFGTPLAMRPDQWIGALLLAPPGAGSIIGPGWTLAYEMYFYLCFAAAMAIPRFVPVVTQPMANGILAAAFLACIALRPVVADGANAWANTATNPLLLEFLAGTAIGWLVHSGRLPTRLGGLMVLAGLGIFALFILVDYDVTTRVVTMGVGSVLIVAGAIGWEVRSGAGRVTRAVGRLGDSSYALYLIHIGVLAVLVRWATAAGWHDAAPAWVIALLLLPVLVALGEILHRTIERPLLAILPARTPFRGDAREPASAAPPPERTVPREGA